MAARVHPPRARRNARPPGCGVSRRSDTLGRMSASRFPSDPAFRRLEAALRRRRFQQLDLRLRVELLALGLLAAGFVGWRVRVPLDGLARRNGPFAAAGALAAALATTWDTMRTRGGRRGFVHLLEATVTDRRGTRVAHPRWSRGPAWLTLWLKDLALSLRPGAARARLATALLLSLASALVWRIPPGSLQ